MGMDAAAVGHEGKRSNTAAKKLAAYSDRILSPVTLYLAWVGAAALGFMVLVLVWSIIARRLFNSPLQGASELTALSLVVIVFAAVAYDSLRHEKMLVEIVVDHFPKGVQTVLAPIIHALDVAILVVLTQQMFVHAERVRGFRQTTRILELPIYVFEYVAAVGLLLLTIVYVKHFLNDWVRE